MTDDPAVRAYERVCEILDALPDDAARLRVLAGAAALLNQRINQEQEPMNQEQKQEPGDST